MHTPFFLPILSLISRYFYFFSPAIFGMHHTEPFLLINRSRMALINAQFPLCAAAIDSLSRLVHRFTHSRFLFSLTDFLCFQGSECVFYLFYLFITHRQALFSGWRRQTSNLSTRECTHTHTLPQSSPHRKCTNEELQLCDWFNDQDVQLPSIAMAVTPL